MANNATAALQQAATTFADALNHLSGFRRRPEPSVRHSGVLVTTSASFQPRRPRLATPASRSSQSARRKRWQGAQPARAASFFKGCSVGSPLTRPATGSRGNGTATGQRCRGTSSAV
jgi:hypothetical protein